MSAPYRPSNGTEGWAFIEGWCARCARDKEMNGTCARESRDPGEDDWCEILSRSFRTDEPLPEWRIGDDGQPYCLAFAASDQPVRCERTADMFGQ
jgi:hypothetical protein